VFLKIKFQTDFFCIFQKFQWHEKIEKIGISLLHHDIPLCHGGDVEGRKV
jgi:hypothetical protein